VEKLISFHFDYNHYGKVIEERKRQHLPTGKMTLLPGKKIICRSNEFDETILVGKCVGLDAITVARQYLPLVKYNSNETVYICFSIIALYTEELYDAVKNLSPEEQYEYLKPYNMNKD